MNLKRNQNGHLGFVVVCFFYILFSAIGYSQDIHRAVYEGNIEKVKLLLEENPLLVNSEDGKGRTPLFSAILRRNPDMVKLLIDKGAVVRVGDNHLRSPIHFAGFMNDTNMISFLLDHGALIDTRAIGGATPLLHSSLNNLDRLSRFLIEQGADINIQCNALTTPLYFAALNNNCSFLSYLLDAGVDMDTPDFLHRTPLYIAVRDGYLEIVRILIEHGSDFHIQNFHSNQNLLHLSAIRGHKEVAELLIRKGLPINGKDIHGCTPMDYAHRYGHKTVVELFKKNGGRTTLHTKMAPGEKFINRNINHGEAIIIKLQNGSWGVRTRKHFLIFSYSETGNPPPDESIVNGYLTGDTCNDIPWFYFDLIFHPQKASIPHQGRNPLYSMQHLVKRLSFILNNSYDRFYSSLNLTHAHFPKTEIPFNIDDMKVTVVPSYEIKKGYVIECDGLLLFWLSGICDDHITSKKDTRAIKFIQARFSSPDLVFLGTPDGIGPEKAAGIRDAYIETMGLNSEAVFFMGKSLLERKILNQIKRKVKDHKNVHCSENPGDYFIYSQRKIK